MKKYLLGIAVLFFGVVGSTSAFNISIENEYGIGATTGGAIRVDTNSLTDILTTCQYTPTDFLTCWNRNNILSSNTYYPSTFYFDFFSGDFLFMLDSNLMNPYPLFGSYLTYKQNLHNLYTVTAPTTKTQQVDRDSVRIFTTGALYNGNATPLYTTNFLLPKYSSLWRTTNDTIDVFLPNWDTPRLTFDIGNTESHRIGPNYSFSTLNCTNKGNNYCTSPVFHTTTITNLVTDALQQRNYQKDYTFYLTTIINKGTWYDNTTRPYSFLGKLSGNKIDFNVYDCNFGGVETMQQCEPVLHGLTSELFGVNYPKIYGPDCGSTLNSETGALLGQALFGNNSINQCGNSTSLGNYFSRIDFQNNLLYVASADLPGYAEQNAITYEVLGEHNIANDYVPLVEEGSISGQQLQNTMASCSGHWNDPAYPGCFIVKVSSGVDPYSLSPMLPSPEKTLLQEALANSGKRDEVYNNCQNPAYYAERSFVCDNVDMRVNGYNPYGTGSGFSINSEKIKINACQSEFFASASDEYNLTLDEVPLVGGIFKSLSIGDVSLTSPFACIEGAINYARNKGFDSSQTLSGSSLVTLSDTAKTKWDSFFNLLLLLPALYFIKKSGAIF